MQLKKICKVIPNNYKLSDNRDTIRYLDTGNLTKNHINNIAIYDNSSDLPSRAKQKVCKGNILFGSVRPEQCHYGYVNRDTSNLLVSTGFIVLTVDESLANSKFIYYRLTRNEIVKNLQLIAQLSTSAYPSITSDDILDLKIDLPDRKIQDKIADLLTKIDNQIERNNEMIQSLQVLGKTIFEKMYKNYLLTYNGKLNNICKLPSGYSFKSEDYNEEGKYKLITIKNVFETFVNTDKTDRLCFLPVDIKEHCKLKIGDILLSLTGNVGRISINTENNCLLNQRVSNIICSNKYKCYIYYLLMDDYYQTIMQKLARGTSQKNLSPVDVENLDIYYPEHNIANFNEKVLPLFNQMVQININTQNLVNLKNNILPLLINGQLK